MAKIYEWLKYNNKAVGLVAAGIAVPTLLHLGFDTRCFGGRSLYGMTDSALRFIPYVSTGLAFGKAAQLTYEGRVGREANFLEKIGLYGAGAAAAAGLWEGWENLGSSDAIHRVLSGAFDGYAKQDFSGSGMESIGDAAKTIAGTEAVVAGKEYASGMLKSKD